MKLRVRTRNGGKIDSGARAIGIRSGLALAVLFLLATVFHPVRNLAGKSRQASTLTVPVDLVSLNVTVVDRTGRIIPGLLDSNFKVYEDGVEQSISFFNAEGVPVSWGLVLDRSGSMESMINEVRQAALNVIDGTSAADDMFVMPFDNSAAMASDFILDRLGLRSSLTGLYAAGDTALYDAVDLALQHVQRGLHSKKVLVLVTDGEDNRSRLKLEDLIQHVEEQRNVMIYPVGLFESARLPWWEDKPRYMTEKVSSLKHDLRKLAEITGASASFPKNVQEGRSAVAAIIREVGQHYSIGYYPANRNGDGGWRNIRVEIWRRGKRVTELVARTRTGYYLPATSSTSY